MGRGQKLRQLRGGHPRRAPGWAPGFGRHEPVVQSAISRGGDRRLRSEAKKTLGARHPLLSRWPRRRRGRIRSNRREANSKRLPLWLRYGVAALAVGVTLGLKLLLDPWITDQSPFLLLAGAVVVGAWFGGLGPGLLATALGAFGAGRGVLAAAPFHLAGATDQLAHRGAALGQEAGRI